MPGAFAPTAYTTTVMTMGMPPMTAMEPTACTSSISVAMPKMVLFFRHNCFIIRRWLLRFFHIHLIHWLRFPLVRLLWLFLRKFRQLDVCDGSHCRRPQFHDFREKARICG